MKYCIFIVFYLFIGCSNKKNDISEDRKELKPPYHIDLERAINSAPLQINLSQIANKINYVHLETNQNCLLKRMYEYLFYNDDIIVTDMRSLYKFDNKGNFIKKIGERGNGPKDYNYITALTMNNESTELYLFTRSKIITYDSDANFINTFPIHDPNIAIYNATMLNTNEFYVYTGFNFRQIGDTSTMYAVLKMNLMGSILDKIPQKVNIESSHPGAIISQIPFYKYDNTLRFMEYGADTLFMMSSLDAKLTPYAIFNLGYMKREINTIKYNQIQMEDLSEKLLITTICEDTSYIYITLEWGLTEKYQFVIFDKKTGDTINIGTDGFINDIDGGRAFFPNKIDEYETKYMCVDAEDYINKINSLDVKKQKEIYGDKFNSIYNNSKKINIDDNYIFIAAK